MQGSTRFDIPIPLQYDTVRSITKRDTVSNNDDRRHLVKRFSNPQVSTDTGCLA
jgi:hypothetical protein